MWDAMPGKLLAMKNASKLALVFLAFSRLAFGYIPPVREMVESVYEGRKPQSGLEVVLSHKIQLPSGQQAVVDERIVAEGNTVHVIWKTQGQTIGATWERQSYVVNGQSLASRSSAFMKYFVGASPEDFLRQLLNEQFVHREQLITFNSGYTPKGDPNTWKSRSFFKLHDDIYFARLTTGAAIAVVGLDEGSVRKAVYFDDDFKGISRLEWREGAGTTTWDFAGFTKAPGGIGLYPKRMTFTAQGVERIVSTVPAVRALKANQLAEFRKSFQAARTSSVSSNAEPVLKILLGYR